MTQKTHPEIDLTASALIDDPAVATSRFPGCTQQFRSDAEALKLAGSCRNAILNPQCTGCFNWRRTYRFFAKLERMEKGPVRRSRRKAFQCFAAIAEVHCGNGSRMDQNDEWFSVRSALATPAQGWKLHLSASIADAAKILERSLPILMAEQVDFKFVGSAKTLARLNEGEYGLPQVGKFITVYPRTDEQAVRIATLLDDALQGLNGPAVPSDRRLRTRSPVYYRYGAFRRRFMQTPLGEIVPVLQGSDSRLVPDIRLLSYIPPKWVTDPFEALGLADPIAKPKRHLANRYLVIAAIRQAGRGDIYLAVDLATPQRCVLKEFREHASLDDFGRSGSERLKHEAEVLTVVSKIPQVPKLLEVVSSGNDHFLVLDDISGISLDSHLNQLARQGKRVPPAQLLVWAKELADICGQIHSCGLVYRDLKAAHNARRRPQSPNASTGEAATPRIQRRHTREDPLHARRSCGDLLSIYDSIDKYIEEKGLHSSEN